jgi:hypothetical protein
LRSWQRAWILQQQQQQQQQSSKALPPRPHCDPSPQHTRHLAPLQQLMAASDADGDGEIDYQEFLAATLSLAKLERDDHLQAAFQELDADGSGTITKDELMAVRALPGTGDLPLARPWACAAACLPAAELLALVPVPPRPARWHPPACRRSRTWASATWRTSSRRPTPTAMGA